MQESLTGLPAFCKATPPLARPTTRRGYNALRIPVAKPTVRRPDLKVGASLAKAVRKLVVMNNEGDCGDGFSYFPQEESNAGSSASLRLKNKINPKASSG